MGRICNHVSNHIQLHVHHQIDQAFLIFLAPVEKHGYEVTLLYILCVAVGVLNIIVEVYCLLVHVEQAIHYE